MQDFEAQVTAYAKSIESFRTNHSLPDAWFAAPDHLAIKCADSTGYEATVAEWLPKSAELYFVHLNGRRLASARLLAPIVVGNLGQVEWLEIMEPRPEKVGVDPVGVDHMEFGFSDFTAAASVLALKGIKSERQENPNHQWLSIIAGGREFKLNNRTLADVVAEEIASGNATKLK